jgi:hypothetical protein
MAERLKAFAQTNGFVKYGDAALCVLVPVKVTLPLELKALGIVLHNRWLRHRV